MLGPAAPMGGRHWRGRRAEGVKGEGGSYEARERGEEIRVRERLHP